MSSSRLGYAAVASPFPLPLSGSRYESSAAAGDTILVLLSSGTRWCTRSPWASSDTSILPGTENSYRTERVILRSICTYCLCFPKQVYHRFRNSLWHIFSKYLLHIVTSYFTTSAILKPLGVPYNYVTPPNFIGHPLFTCIQWLIAFQACESLHTFNNGIS